MADAESPWSEHRDDPHARRSAGSAFCRAATRRAATPRLPDGRGSALGGHRPRPRRGTDRLETALLVGSDPRGLHVHVLVPDPDRPTHDRDDRNRVALARRCRTRYRQREFRGAERDGGLAGADGTDPERLRGRCGSCRLALLRSRRSQLFRQRILTTVRSMGGQDDGGDHDRCLRRHRHRHGRHTDHAHHLRSCDQCAGRCLGGLDGSTALADDVGRSVLVRDRRSIPDARRRGGTDHRHRLRRRPSPTSQRAALRPDVDGVHGVVVHPARPSRLDLHPRRHRLAASVRARRRPHDRRSGCGDPGAGVRRDSCRDRVADGPWTTPCARPRCGRPSRRSSPGRRPDRRSRRGHRDLPPRSDRRRPRCSLRRGDRSRRADRTVEADHTRSVEGRPLDRHPQRQPHPLQQPPDVSRRLPAGHQLALVLPVGDRPRGMGYLVAGDPVPGLQCTGRRDCRAAHLQQRTPVDPTAHRRRRRPRTPRRCDRAHGRRADRHGLRDRHVRDRSGLADRPSPHHRLRRRAQRRRTRALPGPRI